MYIHICQLGNGKRSGNLQGTHAQFKLDMLSLLETLPRIDLRLEKYVSSFNAPNVTLFLRLIRCANLLAFEHMAKTHATAKWGDQFQHSLGFFPTGTAADVDFIMQYTLSNANAVHSLYLTPTPGLSAAQSDNVERPETYAWVSSLIDEIIQDARKPLHRQLRDSPLQRKLLLSHKMVYALLHSVDVRGPRSFALIVPVITPHDLRQMQKKIITSLMWDTIMYYIDTVDRHSEIVYTERLQGERETAAMTQPLTEIRAFRSHETTVRMLGQPTVLQQQTETDVDHAARIAIKPIKYTRLTWPLRICTHGSRYPKTSRKHRAHAKSIHTTFHTSTTANGTSMRRAFFLFCNKCRTTTPSSKRLATRSLTMVCLTKNLQS